MVSKTSWVLGSQHWFYQKMDRWAMVKDLKNRNKYLRNYPCDRTGKNIKITPPPTLRPTSHKRIILPWGHVFKRNIFRILFFQGNMCAKLFLMCVISHCHKLGQLRLTWKEMTSKSKCFPFVKKATINYGVWKLNKF